MLIYRIEDMNGGGIYRGDNNEKNPLGMWSSERHPAPHNDSLLVENIAFHRSREADYEGWSTCGWIEVNEYRFGFSSTDQLRSWVYDDKWLWQMQQNGFRLAVYEVEDAIVGHTQAIFIRNSSMQVSYFNIADFFGVTYQPHFQDNEDED